MEKVQKGIFDNIFLRIVLLVVGVILCSVGTAFTTRTSLGAGSVSGLCINIELMTGTKQGTILAVINYICFVVQIMLLGKKFKLTQVMQIFMASIFGVTLNFFVYDIPFITNLAQQSYGIRMSMFLIGVVLSTFGVSTMNKADLVFLPYEGFCNALIYRLNKPFGKVRPYIDGVIVGSSILLIIIMRLPNISVREGTIIMTILFGKLVALFNKKVYKIGI